MLTNGLNYLSFFKYNYFSKNVQKKKGAHVLPFGKTVLCCQGTLQLNNNLLLNSNKETGHITGRSSIIRIAADAKLCVNDRFNMFYGTDIIVFQGGELILNGGFFNSNVTVRCKNKITVGEDAAISHGVLIQDYDGHELFVQNAEGGTEHLSNSAPITIGNHVLIFANATILKGVTIGDGAIVAAGAVVTNDVPAHTLVAGVPAHVVKTSVDWK